jgi:hypothetical protein
MLALESLFREPLMSRWAMLFVFGVATTGPAFGSDIPAAPHVERQVRAKLPAGLPRAHYKYRTTVTYGAPPPRPVYVERDPDVLFTPSLPYIPIHPLVLDRPLLPGSSTLPGYYGSSHSYEYQGPYYGGPGIVSTWNRLPYACGVYGYC